MLSSYLQFSTRFANVGGEAFFSHPHSSYWSLVRDGEARGGSASVGLLRVVTSLPVLHPELQCHQQPWESCWGSAAGSQGKSCDWDTPPVFPDVSSQQANEFKVPGNALQSPLGAFTSTTCLSRACMPAHVGSFLCARSGCENRTDVL